MKTVREDEMTHSYGTHSAPEPYTRASIETTKQTKGQIKLVCLRKEGLLEWERQTKYSSQISAKSDIRSFWEIAVERFFVFNFEKIGDLGLREKLNSLTSRFRQVSIRRQIKLFSNNTW